MGKFKVRFTRGVFLLVSRFPWLFSKRMRYLLDSYPRGSSGSGKDVFQEESAIVAAGLFDAEVKWKGVSFVAAVGRSDLAKIHKWMSSQKSSPMNYLEQHKEGIFSTNLVGSAYSNLGIVSFDRPNMFAVCTMSIAAELPSNCYISLLRLKNGVSYLSLYVYFKEDVAKEVTQVDVAGIKSYKCLQSANPFSPRFFIMEHHDRRNLIDKKIYENAQNVVSQARQAAAALLEACSVKKSILDFATLADFFREGSGSYFSNESRASTENESDIFTVVHPWRGMHLCSKISDDHSEEYIERYIPEKIGVDAIFIKSQSSDLVGIDNSYGNSLHGVTDHYAHMLMLAEVYSRFKDCMRQVSPVFFKYNISVRASLKSLLKANLELNLIDERLSALEDSLHWCDEKYLQSVRSRIADIRSQVSDLRADVEKRKILSDDELQLANLIWIRKYSIIIFLMIFIQIALSLLSVDWTEAGRGENSIYKNWLSLSK